MPPRRETVREKLLYEYAKLIADSAVGQRDGVAPASRSGERYWSFAMATFARLKSGQITPSRIVRENKLMLGREDECAYCGSAGALQWEHIVPQARGGPDTIDNLVRACSRCNQEKGARDPLRWYADRRAEVPRLVMGKLLKLLFEAHEANGTLDAREFPVGAGLETVRLVEVFLPQLKGTGGPAS